MVTNLKKSSKIRVVDVPNLNTMWTGDVQYIIAATKNPETLLKTGVLPDYLLLGKLISVDNVVDVEPLENTDKKNCQYNITVVVAFSLIQTTTGKVTALFTGYGHGYDVRILKNNENIQTQKYDNDALVAQALKDLPNNVKDQLLPKLKIIQKTQK